MEYHVYLSPAKNRLLFIQIGATIIDGRNLDAPDDILIFRCIDEATAFSMIENARKNEDFDVLVISEKW